MLDLDEVRNTITMLEESDTTFANCQKLASLYIVLQHFNGVSEDSEVEDEYEDILPQYRLYCNIKRKYQLNETTDMAVESAITSVCDEIKEFITTLYSNTDMQKERDVIKTMLKSLETGIYNTAIM